MPPVTICTTSKKKKPSATQLRAKAKHDAWLIKQGLHPDQLKARKSKKRDVVADDNYDSRRTIPTSDTVGNGFKKEENTYTGDKLIGIAVMHKSCLVPVFSKENAEEIARMRR